MYVLSVQCSSLQSYDCIYIVHVHECMSVCGVWSGVC
jgi:hypothetical protein